jgi:hypothetical protein
VGSFISKTEIERSLEVSMFSRMFSIALLCSGFALGHSALAQDAAAAPQDVVSSGSNGSEYMYQSGAGQFNVTPAVLFNAVAVKYNENNTGIKDFTGKLTSIPVSVGGEYGISQMLAIGLNLSYYSSNSSFSCDSSVTNCPSSTHSRGLQDPSIDLKLRNSVGVGTLRYGVDFGFSLEKAKSDKDGNSNAASGGMTYSPFVGYELPLGPGFLGARATYSIFGDRKLKDDNNTDDTTVTGGNSLDVTAFYEANVGKITYGGALSYFSSGSSDSKIGSASSVDQKNAVSGFRGHFYMPVHFTPTITLLPVAGLMVANYTSSGATADAAASVYLGVGGRFTF